MENTNKNTNKNINKNTNKNYDSCEAFEENDDFPALLNIDYLPGPMCMNRLSQSGIFNHLSPQAGYSQKTSTSAKGRSDIVSDLIPKESTACLFTAAWVWLGGKFPENIDIINYGHCRKKPHGHSIRSFRRQLSDEDYVILGKTRVTTPERTICDLAYTPSDNKNYEPYRKEIAILLICNYCVDLRKCKSIIDRNPYFPGSVHARKWLEDITKETSNLWE